MTAKDAHSRRITPRRTSAGLEATAVRDISAALTSLLADMFALYMKTKNFHWHITGSHFRDHHRLLDEQAAQIFAGTDAIAERVRKLGGTTLRSIGHVARLQRVVDNDSEYVTSIEMLAELRDDNTQLAVWLREAHRLCEERGDIATAGVIETWLDEAEGRAWYLSQITYNGDNG
jgi:starvation-inducible DNA-binding protein